MTRKLVLLSIFVFAAAASAAQEPVVPAEQAQPSQLPVVAQSPAAGPASANAEDARALQLQVAELEKRLTETSQGLAQTEDRLKRCRDDRSNEIKQAEKRRSEESKDFDIREKRLLEDVDRLNALLRPCQTSTPDNLEALTPARITDDLVVFAARPNRGGYLRSKLYQELPSGPILVQQKETGWGISHAIKFDGLSENTKYHVEIFALDHSKTQEVRKLADPVSYSVLGFKSRETLPYPAVTVEKTDYRDGKIFFRARATGDARIQFTCSRYSKDKTDPVETTTVGEDLGVDQFDAPVGGLLLSAISEINESCAAKPGQLYAIEWAAVAVQSGRRIERPAGGFDRFETPAPPPIFDFSEGFEIAFTPTAAEIGWKATVTPDTASVALLLNNGGTRTLSTVIPKVEGQDIRISIDLPEILSKRRNDDPDSRRPLRFLATMKKGDQELTQQFSIGFGIAPTKGLSTEQQRAIEKIGEMAKGGRQRVDWKELLEVGLPVILSFF